MHDLIKERLLYLVVLEKLKKLDISNYVTLKMTLSDPYKTNTLLEEAGKVSEMLTGPFKHPDPSVNGLFTFGITRKGLPVGINPEECHCMISGQTGCGKSALLKILLSKALQRGEYYAD